MKSSYTIARPPNCPMRGGLAGTDVHYNRARRGGRLLVLSDVVCYFAGYSNPIKNFVPGLCRTVRPNRT